MFHKGFQVYYKNRYNEIGKSKIQPMLQSWKIKYNDQVKGRVELWWQYITSIELLEIDSKLSMSFLASQSKMKNQASDRTNIKTSL